MSYAPDVHALEGIRFVAAPDNGEIRVAAIVGLCYESLCELKGFLLLVLVGLGAYPHEQLREGVEQEHVLVVQVALHEVVHLLDLKAPSGIGCGEQSRIFRWTLARGHTCIPDDDMMICSDRRRT